MVPNGAPTANDIKVLPLQTSAKATIGRKGQFKSSQTPGSACRGRGRSMTGPVIQLDQFTSLLTEVEAEPRLARRFARVRPRLRSRRRRPVAPPASPCDHRETRGGPLDGLLISP